MTRPPRGQAPSWIGTIIIVVAVAVMVLRAAAELRRSVNPAATDAPLTPNTPSTAATSTAATSTAATSTAATSTAP